MFNDSSGIYLSSSFGRRPRGTIIESNVIGDSLTLLASNKGFGILLDGAVETYIGNPATGKGNKITYNYYGGVEIRNADSSIIYANNITYNFGSGVAIYTGKHNHLLQNLIAVNDYHGVYIDAADSTFIEKDTINYNHANGISVISGKYNQFNANLIDANDYLGIDIGNNGVTLNDVDDIDSGPNEYQNFPSITSVTYSNDTLSILGEVDGAPFTNYYIQYYANYACDPSGFGEGFIWMDSITVTSGANGIAIIDFKSANPYNPSFSNLTFTATDQDGNTSEFSPCYDFMIVAADIEVNNIADKDTVIIGDTVTYTITVQNNGPETATDVTVTDTIASQMTYISDSTNQGSSFAVNNIVTWDIASLSDGASATLTIVTTADTIGTTNNKAFGFANEYDATVQNNYSNYIVETINPSTDINDGSLSDLPTNFYLAQNYPNPFNPETLIEFALSEKGFVSIEIYNIVGQKIKTLINSIKTAGIHSISWNGKDEFDHQVSSGIYLYRIEAKNFTESRKMLLLK